MSKKLDLKLDWASFEAAKYACENWHYSKCLPVGKTVKIGVWESGKFIGCIIFSRGANCNMAKYFGVAADELAELARVALTAHKNQVSRMLSISQKMLLKLCPGLKIIFSYADLTNQGHEGGIYKADNWECLGERTATSGHLFLNGKLTHNRSISAKYGSVKNIPAKIRIEKPLPQTKILFVKRIKHKSNVKQSHCLEGGAIPTDPLHSK